MASRLADMILRELLTERGIPTIAAFRKATGLSKSQAWNLWHGRAQIGLKLAKKISSTTGIPLADLAALDPTPPTPDRGLGGAPRHKPKE